MRAGRNGAAGAAVADALAALEAVDDVDLVCAPDLPRARPPGELPSLPPDPTRIRVLQGLVLDHCDRLGDRFALLDSLPTPARGRCSSSGAGSSGRTAALYYPWVQAARRGRPDDSYRRAGHVAGVYARTDERVGVHKAPANEVLEGVVDLELALNDEQQAELNPYGVNCLRAFPGRGIRVWGARTLSSDPEWRYVSVRRLFLTAGRWIERNLAEVVVRAERSPALGSHRARAERLPGRPLSRGALRGATAEEAFFVKCDAETNPPEGREQGRVVTEIGLRRPRRTSSSSCASSTRPAGRQ